jgi:hypothetical protein
MSAAKATERAPIQEEVVKILRSMNRRSFNVEPAGYFNVLTPSKRFTPSHPPGRFSYLPGQSKGTANPAMAPQFGSIPSRYRNDPLYLRLLRPALLVVAALAVIYLFFWWVAGFPIPRF